MAAPNIEAMVYLGILPAMAVSSTEEKFWLFAAVCMVRGDPWRRRRVRIRADGGGDIWRSAASWVLAVYWGSAASLGSTAAAVVICDGGVLVIRDVPGDRRRPELRKPGR